MSVLVMGWVWNLDIQPNEKLVLLAYADHAHHDGTHVYPSIDLIAKKTSYSRRQVIRITADLERDGYLMPDGIDPDGHGRNYWRIPIPPQVGGDNLTPGIYGGDKNGAEGVTNRHGGGDKRASQMSPESLVVKPSVLNHQQPTRPPSLPVSSDFDDHDVQRMICEVMNIAVFPPQFVGHLDYLYSLCQSYGLEKVRTAATSALSDWTSRRTKDTRASYDRYNPKWIEWIARYLDGFVTKPQKSFQQMTNEEFSAYLEEQARAENTNP